MSAAGGTDGVGGGGLLDAVDRVWLPFAAQYSRYELLCWGTFWVNLAIWITTNLPYLLIDQLQVLRRYKIQPDVVVDRRAMWLQFLKSTATQCLTLPVLLYAQPLFDWGRFQVGAVSGVGWCTLFTQFVWFNAAEDALFYWVHRALHASPWLYRTVHSVHHRHKAPYSVAGAEAHWVELAFNFLLPTVLPCFVCGRMDAVWPAGGTHALLWWVWLWYRELRATEAHSGYVLPWHLSHVLKYVGYCGSAAHDLHHSQIRWNFGSFVWWDHICGTAMPQAEIDKLTHKPAAAAAGVAAKRTD